MNQNRANFLRRSMIAGASIVVAIFANTAAHAQRTPIVVEPNGSAAGVTAQSLINRSGSYVLVRNLVNGSKTGASAIAIVAPNVTLDLQGFTISSTSSKTGSGINATGQSNVVIRNGIITGSGGPAIVAGNNANISGITMTANGSGISCGIGCVARDNLIQGNLGVGMTFSDATSGYVGNVLQGNNGNTVGTAGQVSGGTSLGQNVCNGTTC
jgi:hypothetical protein